MLSRSLLACALMVLAVVRAKESGQRSASDGLKCVTLKDQKNTTVCTGSNAAYTKFQHAVKPNRTDEEVRQRTRAVMRPCTSYTGCENFVNTFNPTLLKNIWGQDRYIFHDDRFPRATAIRFVVCDDSTKWCYPTATYSSQCRQLYRDYSLLAFYPNTNGGPFVDTFRIPDCCQCGYW